jgi:hypothetical protein
LFRGQEKEMDSVEPAALAYFLNPTEVLTVFLLNRYFKYRFRNQWSRIKSWSLDNPDVTHVRMTPTKFLQLTCEQQQQLVSCCISTARMSQNLGLDGFSSRLAQLEIGCYVSMDDISSLSRLTNLQKLHLGCADCSLFDKWYMLTNLTDLKVACVGESKSFKTLPTSLTSLESTHSELNTNDIKHLTLFLLRLKVHRLIDMRTLFGFTKLETLTVTSKWSTQFFDPRFLPPNLTHLNYTSGIASRFMFPSSLRLIEVQNIADYRNLPIGLEHLTLLRFDVQLTVVLDHLTNLKTLKLQHIAAFKMRCFHVHTKHKVFFEVSVPCFENDFDVMPHSVLTSLSPSLQITNFCLVELDHVDLHTLQKMQSLPSNALDFIRIQHDGHAAMSLPLRLDLDIRVQ